MYVVTRPFTGAEGKVYQPGEVVDVSGWKHTDLLVEQRRLRPLTVEPKPKTAPKEPRNAN